MTPSQIFILMILVLHLQCLHTKYLLVDTISNDKGGSVMKKHLESPKHSAPRIKISNKALIPADKKSGMNNKHLSSHQSCIRIQSMMVFTKTGGRRRWKTSSEVCIWTKPQWMMSSHGSTFLWKSSRRWATMIWRSIMGPPFYISEGSSKTETIRVGIRN